MPKNEHVQSSPHYMRCVLEKDIANFNFDNILWFTLVKDTTKDGDGNTRLAGKKIYQLVFKNKPLRFFVWFYYDFRENYAKWDISPVISKILEHRDDLDVSKIKELK